MSSGDTVYNVLVNYKLDSKGAEDGINRLTSSFKQLAGLAAGAMAAFGLERGIAGLINMQSQAESTRIALAGMMQAGGAAGLTNSAEDFTKAMGMSQAIVEKMRKDARDLPGEFEDLVNVFRGGLAGGLGAGKSVNEVEALSARMMAVGATLQLQSDVVGRELAQMLEGRAGAHNALFMRLRHQIGMTAQQFNQLTDAKKWAVIDNALKGYDPAVKAFGNTWAAVSSATTDYAKAILRVGSSAVFDKLKGTLNAINGWYEANQPKVEAFARAVGEKIGNAFTTVISVAQTAWPYISAFFTGLTAGAQAACDFMKEAFGVVGDVLSSIFGDSLTPSIATVETLASVIGAAVPIIAAIEAAQWAWNFAMSANPLGLVVIGVLALTAAVVALIAYWDDLMDSITSIGDNKVGRMMMQKAGFIPAGATDSDINDAMDGTKRNREQRRSRLMKEQGSDGLTAHVKDLFGMGPPALASGLPQGPKKFDEMAKSLLDKKTVASKGNVNVHVRIEQTIETNTDPEMIRIKTREALDQALLHPIESGDHPLLVSR